MKQFEYCAAIRTLGTAGDKYLQTLKSLQSQTIPPKKILVYIAEGYDLPKETIGIAIITDASAVAIIFFNFIGIPLSI